MKRAPLILSSNLPHPDADGVNAPRIDFLELARAADAEVSYPVRRGVVGRWEERAATDARQALAAARRRDVSVYVSLSERVGIPLAFLAARLRRAPHVLVAHRLTSEKKRALQRHTGYLHRFDRIGVLCRTQEAYLREEAGIPPERIRVLRGPVDAQFWRPSRAPVRTGERFVLSVGREARDYQTLLVAARRMPDRAFVVVASSPWSHRRGSSMPTDVPANVTVWQGLSWCDLRDLYARAAVVAVPLIGRTDYAAGANAALEAMAMCRPLVVTATPGIADDVVGEEMALFPPPDDPAALAHYLERSLAHPRLTAQRVDSARATVEARNAVERYVAALAGTIAEVNGS